MPGPRQVVSADEVYGQDPHLRAELARRGLGYVLAVRKSHLVIMPIGPRPGWRDDFDGRNPWMAQKR
jgi:hypothetical protein